MFLIKKLTASDITIVKEVWERLRDADFKGKQMAIVLPRDLLKEEGYPFNGYYQGFEIPLNITFYGPGASGGICYSGEAAICRHSHDWRVHKCIIHPEHYSREPRRFDHLEPADVFVLNADMSGAPVVAHGCFISAGEDADDAAYQYLAGLDLPALKCPDSLIEALDRAGVARTHPVFRAIGIVDEWGAGGVDRQAKEIRDSPDDLWDHVSGAGGEFALKGSLELSQRELDTRLAEARRIGALGENLFNDWLALRPEIGGLRVVSHEWISKENAVSPFDFRVSMSDGSWRDIEVKATAGEHVRMLYISRGELAHMADAAPEDVILARISMADSNPELRLAFETSDAALLALDGETFPDQVDLVSVAVQPDYFSFESDVIRLDRSE